MTRNEILDHCLSELRRLGEEDMALAIEALKERTSVATCPHCDGDGFAVDGGNCPQCDGGGKVSIHD